MDYEEFEAYIYSLEDSGETLTEQGWREWINHESDVFERQSDQFKRLTDDEIDSVIERLYEDGYVKED